MMNNPISMQNISMEFPQKKALDDVSLNVSKGEIFGLLGPSGAGKTTMIKILTGQLKPTSGSAQLNGHDTNNLPESVYSKIGMVLDTSGLYTRLSCYDNLKIFSDIYAVDKSKIMTALEVVQLKDSAKLAASKLSKGMAQRLVFARALLNNPTLLFLDEPTSGLDPATAQELHKIIFDMRENGTTVFLTTHNMTEAQHLCDHVALLNEGKIIEYDEPSALCRKYNTEPKINVLLKDNTQLTLDNNKQAADTIAGFIANEQLESIHSSEPDLETVFIALTGRKLV